MNGCPAGTKNCHGHSGTVSDVSFSPNGQQIASAGRDDHTVKLWKRDGTLLRTFAGCPQGTQTCKGHTDRVRSVSFSPNGAILATAGDDNQIKFWTLNGTLLRTLSGPQKPVSFSPDGQTLASLSRDHTIIRLWNLNGTLLRTLRGHKDWVSQVSFSADGQHLVSSGYDNQVMIWSQNGQLLKTLVGHTGWVNGAVFSPDGHLVASASQDSTIKLWDLQGHLLRTIEHPNALLKVAFSPDSRSIAVAGSDTSIKIWQVDQEDLKIPQLGTLLDRSCGWLKGYLQNNATLPDADKQLCNKVKGSG
jgi:WD40 repeat protein